MTTTPDLSELKAFVEHLEASPGSLAFGRGKTLKPEYLRALLNQLSVIQQWSGSHTVTYEMSMGSAPTPAASSGQVLVPLEPTGEMQASGRDALIPYVGELLRPVTDQWQLARDVWRAMHAVAPTPADDCPNPNGCDYCREFGCPRAVGVVISTPAVMDEGFSSSRDLSRSTSIALEEALRPFVKAAWYFNNYGGNAATPPPDDMVFFSWPDHKVTIGDFRRVAAAPSSAKQFVSESSRDEKQQPPTNEEAREGIARIIDPDVAKRLVFLTRWLRHVRTLSQRPGDVGEAYGGIVEAFDEKALPPETLADDITLLGQKLSDALGRERKLKGELDELRLVICGGEDAPGYNASLSHEAILGVLRDNYETARRDGQLAWDGETATSWKARAEALSGALTKARDQFRKYQADHAEKALALGPRDRAHMKLEWAAEYDARMAKSNTNGEFADLCEAALAAHPSTEQPTKNSLAALEELAVISQEADPDRSETTGKGG